MVAEELTLRQQVPLNVLERRTAVRPSDELGRSWKRCVRRRAADGAQHGAKWEVIDHATRLERPQGPADCDSDDEA